MDLQTQKLELIQMLIATDSEDVIKKVRSAIYKYIQPFEDETDYLNSTKSNKIHLANSIDQLNEGKGKVIKTEDLWK